MKYIKFLTDVYNLDGKKTISMDHLDEKKMLELAQREWLVVVIVG